MSATLYFRQCHLVKKTASGTVEQTSWIPERFASLGAAVRLRNPDGEWEDGWVVQFVGARREQSALPDSHKEIKAHRRATGDAEAKAR